MKYKWHFVVITTLWSIFAISQAVQIGPLTSTEEFVSRDHPSQHSTQVMMNNFTTTIDS